MRYVALITAWLLALLGGFFAVAGAQLAWLGGSLYYLLTGLAMVASGALIGRADRRGRTLFLAVWIATVVWAVWEAGLQPLWLMPRVLAPTVLLLLVYLPPVVRGLGGSSGRRAAATAAVALLAMLGVRMVVTGDAARAQPAPGVLAQAGPGDWTHYGGTLAGDRFSALNQITPANVGQLEQVWVQRTGDLPMRAEAGTHEREYHSEATPIHVGDTLYTCTPHSFVQAIDATTGRTKWSWHTDAPVKGNSYLVCRGVSYFEAPAGTPCPHRIFAPSFDAKMWALDADRGKPCPSFANHGYIDLRDNMGPSPRAMQISTSPPVVANGRLVIGERIIDYLGILEAGGVVRAYDPVSGAAIWAWDVGRGDDAIPALPKDQMYTRGTPNVWGAMTVDPANGIVYLGTGNATPDYWIRKRRPFDDKYGTSIVALDLATGKMRWRRQLVHRDMWDMDLPVGPSPVDLPQPGGGGTVPALVQTTKMGQVYLLNRLTGAPLAAIEERRVSNAGGMTDERFSPPSLSRPACPRSPRRPRPRRTHGARRRLTSWSAASSSARRTRPASTPRSAPRR